jgi:hypothetical protein
MMALRREPMRAGPDYWRAIERCLVEFHGWDNARAHERVERFIGDLAPVRPPDVDDLILHENPFEIAGDMAGHYLDPFVYRERYEPIFEACKREYAEKQAAVADDNAESHLVGRAATD